MGVLTAVGTGLGIIGQIVSYNAQVQQAQAQAAQAVKSMNYQIQNLEIQRQDSFDAAVQDISKTRINAMNLNSSVDAAVNEEMSGRTAKLIQRSVRGDEARGVSSIQENFQRKSNEVDLNEDIATKSTRDYVDSIKGPNVDSLLVGIAGSLVGGFSSIMNQKATAQANGMDWDFFKGAIPRKNPTLAGQVSSSGSVASYVKR